MSVGAIWEGLLDLLAPRRCAACDEVLEPGGVGFCGGCDLLLDPAPEDGGSERGSRQSGARAAFLYAGPMAHAIRRFKYGGHSELSTPLGQMLSGAAVELLGEVDAVVPVPLHPRRLRVRGFDQAALLARPVAHRLGVPLVLRGARRARDTPPQASLDAESRLRNVRGAFEADAVAPRVLLIDDVRTTGATLAACAEALRDAGAERVRTLVLAAAEV